MKIQNLILKGGSPECLSETLTKSGKQRESPKQPLEHQTTSGEHADDDVKTTRGEVSPFGLPKKSGQNESGVTTIFGGLKTKEDERLAIRFICLMRF